MPPMNPVMTRRSLLQSVSVAAAGIGLSGTGALSQARAETLLVVQELGPNSLDMPGSPTLVSGDDTRLRQMVGNLLANARDAILASGRSGGHIQVRIAAEGGRATGASCQRRRTVQLAAIRNSQASRPGFSGGGLSIRITS